MQSKPADRHLDVLVIGAGFSGLYMLRRARDVLGLDTLLVEAGEGVGGTWFWNRYPGARCDSESMYYSYSFDEDLQQEWEWSRKYPAQPEILSYLNHVADRFDLRRSIQLDSRVTSAIWNESTGRWTVETDRGQVWSTTYLVSAVGCLSAANVPDVPGADTFAGELYHTGQWPRDREVSFAGKRVGIIGTGSTGIQAVPVLAEESGHLYVFQRTPQYTLPARDRLLHDGEQAAWKARYDEIRRACKESQSNFLFGPPLESALDATHEERQARYESRWEDGGFAVSNSYMDLGISREANDTAAEFVRSKIRSIVTDPETHDALCPDYPLGGKRTPLDSGFYAAFNRPNVTLVPLRSTPIDEITATGIRCGDDHYDLDMLIFATGFDAMTGPLLRIDIRGRDGQTLRDKWATTPGSYLGLQIAGFPNLFTITGPGSPSVLGNMPLNIEDHVEWIGDCIVALRQQHLATIEADPDAESEWMDHVTDVASDKLIAQTDNWYSGANIAGKKRVFLPYLGGCATYRRKLAEVVADDYAGFVRK
ncbi:MAG: NAD(P)/FAD-dependent oxidoreductase [Ilumatobacteraceae bacterium]